MQPARLDSKNSGFVSLVTVLVVGAVGLAVAISLILLGLGASRTSLTLGRSVLARAYADSCAEEALQKLRESVYYTGGETISFANGSCQIQTVDGAGNLNRTVQAVGTVGAVVRKVKVTVSVVQPTISITSWLEVGDF